MMRLVAFILLCIGIEIMWTGWAELNHLKPRTFHHEHMMQAKALSFLIVAATCIATAPTVVAVLTPTTAAVIPDSIAAAQRHVAMRSIHGAAVSTNRKLGRKVTQSVTAAPAMP